MTDQPLETYARRIIEDESPLGNHLNLVIKKVTNNWNDSRRGIHARC